MEQDYEIFKGKKFSDLCQDIVKNSEEKKAQLDILTTDLRAMINTLADAVTTVPLIKEYLEVGIRNDEQLIKLAAIIQRLMGGKSVGEDGSILGLTEEEKAQLLKDVEKVAKEAEEPKTTKTK